jgi:hypothetical protein
LKNTMMKSNMVDLYLLFGKINSVKCSTEKAEALYPKRRYSLLGSITGPEPQMPVRKLSIIHSPDILELAVSTVSLKS